MLFSRLKRLVRYRVITDYAAQVPVSRLVKSVGDDEPAKKNRDDYRKAKELEEARKLGTVPAAVDEFGKDINPHIPQENNWHKNYNIVWYKNNKFRQN